MSAESREDRRPSPGGEDTGRNRDAANARSVERRLEMLAEEIGRAIETGPSAEREALHDYAVSLVRDRLPTAQPGGDEIILEGGAVAERPDAGQGSAGNAATLIAYGFLLVPAAFVVGLVFFPIGILLAGSALALMAAGGGLVVATRIARLLPGGRRREAARVQNCS